MCARRFLRDVLLVLLISVCAAAENVISAAPGDVDLSFNAGTLAHPTENPSVRALAVQTDGKIIVGGNFGLIGNTACSNIARLDANGSLETALGNVAGISSNVDAIALQPDGKIVIGGGCASAVGTRFE